MTPRVILLDPRRILKRPTMRVSYQRGRMKSLPRYTITLLVALAAFLPVLWGAFPEMPLWVRIARQRRRCI
jgi:hypothetical protein